MVDNTLQPAAKIFNGVYTLRNRETGDYRTFQIRTQPDDAKFAPGKRIIALLTGPENTSDYQGFGFVDDTGIHVWRSKRGDNFQKSSFEWFAEMLWGAAVESDSTWADKYEVMCEGRCIICNRRLTTPESITTGIGPVCATKGGI